VALLTSLDRVKAIAQDDAFIQDLQPGDAIVAQALEYAEIVASEEVFGRRTAEAQDYFAAHTLSIAGQPSGGRGPVSSSSAGGVSRSFTLPYLNRTTVLGATQYGNRFLDIRNEVVAPIAMIGLGGRRVW